MAIDDGDVNGCRDHYGEDSNTDDGTDDHDESIGIDDDSDGKDD